MASIVLHRAGGIKSLLPFSVSRSSISSVPVFYSFSHHRKSNSNNPSPIRHFTTTTSKMSASTTPHTSQTLIELMKNRRTYYALTNKSTIPDSRIKEIVESAVLHVPSSFNSQSSRIVLLLKEEHEKLWDITTEVLKGVVPPEQFEGTAQKLAGFRGGYGTILFYTHRPTVAAMQSRFALYADKFPIWAIHSDGMHQYAIWTALEADGLGANLQHYNPLIDIRVQEEWGVDKDWELSAQMVFGTPAEGAKPKDKTFLPLEERIKVFGA